MTARDHAPQGAPSPRTDGCYVCLGPDGIWMYIRFLAKAWVTTVSSYEPPRRMCPALGPGSDALSYGPVEEHGEELHFATHNDEGTVEFVATLAPAGTMQVRSRSLINGVETRGEYSFFPS